MGMFRTLAMGVVGFSLYSTLRQRTRRGGKLPAKPEPLQRWEGEGGNVPAANPGLQTAGADGGPSAAADRASGRSSL